MPKYRSGVTQLRPKVLRSVGRKRRQQKRKALADFPTHPIDSPASSPYSSFTNSIREAMEVLKCQRLSKSTVIFPIVGWSLRNAPRSDSLVLPSHGDARGV